ncbi:MAG: hypothetical protein RR697_03525 [Malacoplasma sp.]
MKDKSEKSRYERLEKWEKFPTQKSYKAGSVIEFDFICSHSSKEISTNCVDISFVV